MRSLINRISSEFTAAFAPRPATAAIRRGPVLALVLCGCFLTFAIVLGTVTMIGEFRERALHNSERELKNTVLLLTRHFDQQFDDADILARDIVSQMDISAITSPEVFKDWMSTPDAHALLKSRISALSYMGDINIFDADGHLINSSSSGALPSVNVSDRAYFKAFKSGSKSVRVLTEPVQSYLTGKWTTVIAYRLTAPNGAFLGVMGRRVDPANFEKFFASVALGDGAAISMFHRNGTLLARYPHVDSLIGQQFKSAPLINRVAELGGLQTLMVQSPVDGLDRVGAAAALTDYPIVVVATNKVAAAVADWRA
jgi:hypothetical protein